MRYKNKTRNTMLAAAFVAAGSFCAQSLQHAVAQEQEGLEGPIVQIGEASEDDQTTVTEAAPATPSYWIGLSGRGVDDPVLRTQLQLAEDMGVVIEEVVPESPAAKAELRKHDIVLRSNGDVVDSMAVLQQQVEAGKDKPIELKVLRLGKEISVTVTPETRPADFEQKLGGGAIPGQEMLGGDIGRLLQQFGGDGAARLIGPGMVLNNRQFNLNAVPNGVSVSVQRDGEGPAKITVKKGDQTWNLSSDDAKALAELPEEVRNYVSGMLHGQGGIQQQLGNLDWQAELRHMLPKNLGNLGGDFKAQEEEMNKRLEQLEEQIQALQEQIKANTDHEAP